MFSRNLLCSLVAAGLFIHAAELTAKGEYFIHPIPGLELTRGQTITIEGSQGNAHAHRFHDGRICAHGDGNTFSFWSDDKGKTWKKGPLGPTSKMIFDFGDGEILDVKRDLVARDDGKYTAYYDRSTDNWKTVERAEGLADVPLTTTIRDENAHLLTGMLMHHGIVQLPSGDLLATLYGNYKGDRVLLEGFPLEIGSLKTRTVVIRSSDRGKTWGDPVTVAYDTMLGVLNEPDITGSQTTIVPAVTQEGFNEADLAIAPNGDVICVMRGGGSCGDYVIRTWPTPLYISRSSDAGKTWSVPEQIADRGACPNLVTLENGIIVCSYSRPGAWLIFSDDNGKSWKGPTQFGPANSYVYVVDVAPDTVLAFQQGSGGLLTTFFTVRKSDAAPSQAREEYPYFHPEYYHCPAEMPQDTESEYPIKPVPDLELTRGDTVQIPGAMPLAFRLNDGRIFMSGDNVGYWSEDGGKTFEEGPVGPSDKMAFDFGDGEIISISRDIIPRADGKFTVNYRRSIDDWKTVEDAEGIADVPLATSTSSDQGTTVPSMLMHHGIVELKDGTLLATLYGNYKGDRVLCDAYNIELGCLKRRVVAVSSTDRGKTWGNPTEVAYDSMLQLVSSKPVIVSTVPAVTQEGFTEPDLTIAPNGDIVCVMRTGGAWGAGIIPTWPTCMYVSRSSDGGKSWSVPEQMSDRGVCPQLVTLKNGIIVCSYSRPGAWLIFSDDNGKTWKGAQQFDYHNNYIYIVEAGPDTVFATRYARPNEAGAVGTFFTVRKKS